MTNLTRLFIFFAGCFIMSGCFISDSLIEDFRKINASVEKSNEITRLRIAEAMYATLHRANSSMYLRVDTLDKLNGETCRYIDSLKKVMLNYDPKGDNINLPSDLFVNTVLGATLQQKLASYYVYATNIVPDTVKPVAKEMEVYQLKATINDTTWVTKHFRNVPTMSAITSLTSTERDCLDLEERVLKHLNAKLKAK